jgi:hypothetical protein
LRDGQKFVVCTKNNEPVTIEYKRCYYLDNAGQKTERWSYFYCLNFPSGATQRTLAAGNKTFVERVVKIFDVWFPVSDLSQISETDSENATLVKFKTTYENFVQFETIPFCNFTEESPTNALVGAGVPEDEANDGRRGEALSWDGTVFTGETTGGSYAGEFGTEYEPVETYEEFSVETLIKFRHGYVPSWIFAPANTPVLS